MIKRTAYLKVSALLFLALCAFFAVRAFPQTRKSAFQGDRLEVVESRTAGSTEIHLVRDKLSGYEFIIVDGRNGVGIRPMVGSCE